MENQDIVSHYSIHSKFHQKHFPIPKEQRTINDNDNSHFLFSSIFWSNQNTIEKHYFSKYLFLKIYTYYICFRKKYIYIYLDLDISFIIPLNQHVNFLEYSSIKSTSSKPNLIKKIRGSRGICTSRASSITARVHSKFHQKTFSNSKATKVNDNGPPFFIPPPISFNLYWKILYTRPTYISLKENNLTISSHLSSLFFQPNNP